MYLRYWFVRRDRPATRLITLTDTFRISRIDLCGGNVLSPPCVDNTWGIGASSTHGYKSNGGNIRELNFLMRGRQPEESISCARTVVSPRFLH